MKNVLISTTDTIDGRKVERYLGLVTTNLVIGTNVFSDFVASFSDFFGGMSGTYRKQLQQLYDAASADLSMKAQQMGANAIIGTRIDFDEISGKGKSMFMVSMSGTAVVLDNPSKDIDADSSIEISSEYLKQKVFVESFPATLSKKGIYNGIDWNFINSHQIPELIDILFEQLLICNGGTIEFSVRDAFNEHFKEYLSNLDESDLIKSIYKYPQVVDYCVDVIKENKVFDPRSVLELLKAGQLDFAIKALSADKVTYTNEDLTYMKQIVQYLDNLPDLGHFEETKGGFLSSGGKRYICPNGHQNNVESDFCYTCNRNIKGILSSDIGIIESFKNKVTVLEKLLI